MADEDQNIEQEQDLPTPSDEEMKGWRVDPPDEGPAPVTGVLPKARAKTLRKRVEEARGLTGDGIKPAMSTEELRAAGVGIDLPTEAASEDPKGIAYADGTTLEERLERRYQERTQGSEGLNDEGGAPGT